MKIIVFLLSVMNQANPIAACPGRKKRALRLDPIIESSRVPILNDDNDVPAIEISRVHRLDLYFGSP